MPSDFSMYDHAQYLAERAGGVAVGIARHRLVERPWRGAILQRDRNCNCTIACANILIRINLAGIEKNFRQITGSKKSQAASV